MEQYYDKLFPRRKNQVRNSLVVNQAENMNAYGPFVHHSLKRSLITKSKFLSSNLSYSAWTETYFNEVNFEDCKLNSSNMQLCVFNKCLFTDQYYKMFRNISFCNSFFKKTKFENIIFKNCVLTDATFISCQFINCKFLSSSFDGTKFIDCHFDRLVARNMNLDYSQYRNCIFTNSQISLFQIAYTIGLLQCISINDTNELAFQGREISSKVFFEEYKFYLLSYFESRRDLYPLANLCYFSNNNNAKNYILAGIKEAIIQQKYKLVLHYCELINYYNCLTSKEKRELITFLNTSINSIKNENIGEAIKYSVQIEHCLLNKYDTVPHYYISLETDYTVKNADSISSLISELDNVLMLEQGEKGEHNITITHNSPLWLDIIIALACNIAAPYINDLIIRPLINKIKLIFENKKAKLKKITIKGSNEDSDIIIEENDDKNSDSDS